MMEAPKNSFDSLDKQEIQLAGTATSAPYGLPDTNTSLHGLALPIGLDTQKSGQIKAELISTALLTSYEPDTLVPVPFLPSQADPITGSTKLSLASLDRKSVV